MLVWAILLSISLRDINLGLNLGFVQILIAVILHQMIIEIRSIEDTKAEWAFHSYCRISHSLTSLQECKFKLTNLFHVLIFSWHWPTHIMGLIFRRLVAQSIIREIYIGHLMTMIASQMRYWAIAYIALVLDIIIKSTNMALILNMMTWSITVKQLLNVL